MHAAAEIQVRSGAEYFAAPSGAGQRRYEALRAYFMEEATAAEVADRFGYSTASVHQMATLLRTGKLDPFTETKPGQRAAQSHRRGPRQGTGVAGRRPQHRRDRRGAGRRGHADLGADSVADPRRRRATALARRDEGPPRQPGTAGAGQSGHPAGLARRRADPV